MHHSVDPPAALDREPLADRVARLLQSRISGGEWPLGSKLPNESQLAAELGVGRNTIREAVSSLVQAGVLRREQGRGTFVLATSEFSGPFNRRLERTTRREALELRLALDAAASRIAAERRTDADVATLTRLLGDRARSWQGAHVLARMAADTALHRAVVAATHNTLLQEVYDPLVSVFDDVLAEDVRGGEDTLAAVHDDLVDCIVRRDPLGAEQAVVRLVQPLIDALDRETPAHGVTHPQT